MGNENLIDLYADGLDIVTQVFDIICNIYASNRISVLLLNNQQVALFSIKIGLC